MVEDPRGEQALRKSQAEIGPNLAFYGVAVFFIVLLGSLLPILGAIGLVLFGVLVIFNLYRMIVVVGIGTVMLVAGRSGPKTVAATGIMLVETAVMVAYVSVLYYFFAWPSLREIVESRISS